MLQRLELTNLLFRTFYVTGTVDKINKKYFLLINIKRENRCEILVDHNWFKINKKDLLILNQTIQILVKVSRYKKGYKLFRV